MGASMIAIFLFMAMGPETPKWIMWIALASASYLFGWAVLN